MKQINSAPARRRKADTDTNDCGAQNGHGQCSGERNAVVVVDFDGRIADCNLAAAELFDRQPDKMPGEALKALIPGVPFGANTPGYNLAFAGFHAAGERWLSGTARLGDGCRIAVDIAFRTARKNRQRFIVLTLRPSVAG